MIEGLKKLLGQIEPWEEIKSILTGEIKHTKSVSPLTLSVQYETPTGVKCIAHSGTAVQEVFIVTKKPQDFISHLEDLLG